MRSSLNEAEGTIVKEEVDVESTLISGVAVDKNTARIAVIGVEDKPGTAFKIFDLIGKNNINIDIIIQSIKDYWQTLNESRYITELSLPVRSLE